MYYNRKKERVGYVFRNRFKSQPILSKKQMYTCIKYIHMNPVKAGIVKEEKDYNYSSYNDYLYQTGFINQEVLNFVFQKNINYLKKFKSIQYQNIYEKEKQINLRKSLKNFIKEQEITLNQIRKDKSLIQEFVSNIISDQYMYSKKELAQILGISLATLYRRLEK